MPRCPPSQLRLRLLASLLGCAACEGTDDDPASKARICDGSDGLRLAYRPSTGPTDNAVLVELGVAYVYVSGDCRYWVMDEPAYTWAATREGVLTEEEEGELLEGLRYGAWANLRGAYAGSHEGDDGRWLSDGTSTIFCGADCEISGAPTEVIGIFDEATAWREKLWERGTPATGPLRVVLTTLPGGLLESYTCEVDWPLAWDPSMISHPDDGQGNYAKSDLIDDTADVAVLRDLRQSRRQIANECTLGTDQAELAIQEGADFYELVFRDSVPLENAVGLIPLPPP